MREPSNSSPAGSERRSYTSHFPSGDQTPTFVRMRPPGPRVTCRSSGAKGLGMAPLEISGAALIAKRAAIQKMDFISPVERQVHIKKRVSKRNAEQTHQ